MKFDVIIGNPPYQLGSSGGDSQGSFAMPIYQKFVQTAKSLDPRYVVMVTPSRWFAGGRGLDEYRSEMLSDTHLRELVDFPDATDVFPGLDISGGVSYFLWDRSHDGPCNVQTFIGGVSSGVVARRLDAYNVFVRYNTGVSILEKVWPKGVDVGKSLAVKVSPTQPFGLRTSYRGAPTAKGLKNPVVLRSSEGESWIARADVPRNDHGSISGRSFLDSRMASGELFLTGLPRHLKFLDQGRCARKPTSLSTALTARQKPKYSRVISARNL